jgi:hypothetical protein
MAKKPIHLRRGATADETGSDRSGMKWSCKSFVLSLILIAGDQRVGHGQ